VYLGSSRMGPGHSHYKQALELGREASDFIYCFLCFSISHMLVDICI
jgi:hypothetical protein